ACPSSRTSRRLSVKFSGKVMELLAFNLTRDPSGSLKVNFVPLMVLLVIHFCAGMIEDSRDGELKYTHNAVKPTAKKNEAATAQVARVLFFLEVGLTVRFWLCSRMLLSSCSLAASSIWYSTGLNDRRVSLALFSRLVLSGFLSIQFFQNRSDSSLGCIAHWIKYSFNKKSSSFSGLNGIVVVYDQLLY